MRNLVLITCVLALFTVSLSQNFNRLDGAQSAAALPRYLRNFGFDRLKQRVVQDSPLYNFNDFVIAQEFGVWRRDRAGLTDYYYWVRGNFISNANQYIVSNYTIEFNPTTRAARVTGLDYQYNYDENSDESDAYNNVPAAQFNDALIRRLVSQGQNFVAGRARYRNQIPSSAVFNTRVEEIKSRQAGDLTFYKIELELRDAARNLGIDTDFKIQYNRARNLTGLLEDNYDLTDNNNNSDDNDSDNSYSDFVGRAPQ